MLLLVNVDDITGEMLPHVTEGLMERGANSVHVVPALTKKGRSEFLFFIDADAPAVDALAAFLARELGTLGVRVFEPRHICFEYRFCSVLVDVPDLSPVQVRVKLILDSNGAVISEKAESRDLQAALAELAAAGNPLSLASLKRLVEITAASRMESRLGPIRAVCSDSPGDGAGS